MRKGVAIGCVFGLVLAVAGCSGDDPVPGPSDTNTSAAPTASPTGTDESPTDAPTEPADPSTVSADVQYLGMSIRLDVAPILVRDGIALLSVDYSLGADAPVGMPLAIGNLLKPATGPMGVGAIRLVDPVNTEVLLVGRDDQKQPATTRDPLSLAPGGTVHSEAFFAAPSGETVDVLFPYFGLVQNVPVEQATGDLPTSPVELGRSGTITYDTVPIDAFVVAFDDSSSSRVTGKDVTVSLASDVLFAVDKFKLTTKAQKVVDNAAKKIQKIAVSGDVSVIGHTDDVGDDAYNQTLSVKRAESVVARLSKTLGADFELKAEGRGESEPAVGGASAEARAMNRRVEIRFQAKTTGAAIDVGEIGAKVPKATGPVVAGSAPALVTVRDSEFLIEALSVRRAGPYLVGSLRVEATKTGMMLELFGTATQGLAARRGLKMATIVAGAHNLSLLGEGSRFYPADYVTQAGSDGVKDQRAILADQFLSGELKQGQSITVTAIWPDPGGDTVTIDVPDRFRITDVPVTP